MSSFDKITELLIQNKASDALKIARNSASEYAGKENEHGLAVAKAAAAAYRLFVHQPVGEFVKHAPDVLPEGSAKIVEKGFSRLFDNSKKWMVRVEHVREERLARDLMDYVRGSNGKAAINTVARIIAYSKNTEEALNKRASYIGSVVGSVLSREKEAEKVVQFVKANPEKIGITAEQAEIMEDSRQKRRASISKAGLDNLETQWYQTIKTVQTDILNEFPTKNKLGEPEEEDLKKIGDIFRDIFRSALIKNDPELFIDASIILLDFCPHETSMAAKQSGIEGRGYDEMGYTGKKTAGLCFMELGESDLLSKAYADWGKSQLEGKYGDPIIEMMGAFRNEVFAPILLDVYGDKKHKSLQNDVLEALSNLTSPHVAQFFLKELQKTIKSQRAIDAKIVRESKRYITGLGKIAKSPRTDEKTRSAILTNTIKIIPRNSTQLTLAAISDVLAAKPSHLDEDSTQWVVSALVDTIWIPQQSSGLDQKPDPKAGALGKRYPYVKALNKFTKSAGDFIVEEMKDKASRYSPAFIAAAEVLQNIKSDYSATMLKKMIDTSIHFDERQLVEHQMEKYYDDAEEEYRPITQDLILEALCSALLEVDEEAGKQKLQDVLNAMKSNILELRGNKIMEMITNKLGVSALDKKSDAPSPTRTQEPKVSIDPAEVKELIKKLRARYFMAGKKKVSEKVTALARLGEVAPPQALDAVMEQLHEKDAMIQSAAAQTIAGYMNPNQHETIRQDVLFQCLQGLLSNSETYQSGCKAALKAMNPNRRDIRPEIVKFGHSVNNGSVRLAIQEILGGTFLENESSSVAKPVMGDSEAPDDNDENAEPAAPSGLQKMQMKQEYFAARKAWINGGKKGPEPKKPEGI